jgi:hypothetical protein
MTLIGSGTEELWEIPVKIILITQFQTCDRFKTTKTKAKFYVRDLFSALNNENVFKMFDIMIL